MALDWLSTLTANPGPLAYISSIAGKPFSTQWLAYAGTEAGAHRIELTLDFDPVAAGLAGPRVVQYATLLCADDGRALHYRTRSSGRELIVEIGADQCVATLPDGSRHSVPRGDARYVVEGQLPALLTLLLMAELAIDLPEPRELTVLVPSGLVNVPYRLERVAPADRLHLQTSHGELITLDDRGVMIESRMPKQGVEVRLQRPAPPLPRSDETAAPPPLRYTPPQGARFRLEDVRISGPTTQIGATLTIPHEAKSSPAVLFIAGTGLHDRHGIADQIDIGSHEIVDGLANDGFVGLRYDKRGAGTTSFGPDALDLGLEALISDAAASLEYLRNLPHVAPSRVFLVGHSQGGVIALALATRYPEWVSGVALLACPGRSIDAIIAQQLRERGEKMGLAETAIEAQIADIARVAQLARDDRPWNRDEVPHELFAALRSRRWFKEHLENPPAQLVERLRSPLLLLQGAKDFQVSAAKDTPALFANAARSGLDVTARIFTDLDHLFKPTNGRSTPEQYLDRSRRVEPKLIAFLSAWLTEHART
jgi:pimeloyl-ACP methyl ester carboxylesterase